MRRSFRLCGLALLASASQARADDGCSPDFGDKALDWVSNHAATQSRELAKADYEARTFNFRLVGFERLHERLTNASKLLEDTALAINTLDKSSRSDVALAVEREQSSEKQLTELYRLASEFEVARQQLRDMTTTTDRAGFRRDGLGAVGRETLVASLKELGAASESTLGGRYSFMVQVTFDDSGNPQRAHAESSPGSGALGIGTTLISTGDHYAVVAGAVIIIGGSILEARCADNWERQRKRMQEAVNLLPSKLITEQEQWALFHQAEVRAADQFKDHGAASATFIKTLEERWKTLFAANASRAAAAEAVLTDAKITKIRQDLQSGLDPAAIFEQVAITNIGAEIGKVNAAIAHGRVAVLTSCLDARGLAAEEDQRDGIAFARAQFKAFREQAGFAPLHDLLDKSDALAGTASVELAGKGPTAAKRACSGGLAGGLSGQVEALHAIDSVPAASISGGSRIAAPRMAVRTDRPSINFLSTLSTASLTPPTGSISYCALFTKDGKSYTCDTPSAGASGYGDDFGDSGNPRRDIHQHAGDGGFANDSRQMSDSVDAARNNIDLRIQQTAARAAQGKQAFGDWETKNTSALNTAKQDASVRHLQDIANEAAFEAASAPLLADARQALDDFTAAPVDPARLEDLVEAVGGQDMRLPSIPKDTLTTSVPEIVGVEASEAAFGEGLSEIERRAARERLKADRDLGEQGESRSLSNAMIEEAVRFQRLGGNAGQKISNELLLDSAALRFAAKGRLPQALIATVEPDGSIVRRPVSDLSNLPENALIRVVCNFQLDDNYYQSAAIQLRGELAGGSFAARRGDVADTADELAELSRGAFYSGDLRGGQALMTMAIGTLDIATRFIPGVDWGRDVYEAVSGKDLFTGAELSDFDRVGAIIGVVTAGVGNNGLQVVKAFDRIADLSLKRTEEVYEFAKTLDRASESKLTYSAHALERMEERFLEAEDVRRVLDDHKPFWNKAENTFVAIGEGQVTGERVGVAINTRTNVITTVMTVEGDDAAILAQRATGGRLKGEKIYEEIVLDD